jgi:hypothetical protein
VILVDLLEGAPGGGFDFCLGAMVEAADQVSLKPWTEVDARFTKTPGAAEQERKCSTWLISTWKKGCKLMETKLLLPTKAASLMDLAVGYWIQ